MALVLCQSTADIEFPLRHHAARIAAVRDQQRGSDRQRPAARKAPQHAAFAPSAAARCL